MDVREKLVELIGSTEYGNGSLVCKNFQKGFIEKIASNLIANGVTVQEWISVDDMLPEESEYVIIWCGECQIAKIEKGISEKKRELMKSGEINDPVEIGWNMSDGHFKLKRSESYRACDEGFNNKVPYCWYINGGMMKLFGQNVTHWMPIPQPPKG